MSCKIKYKGAQIAEMTTDGTKTLRTSGKYCDGNISVEYTGGALQEKTVTPTTAQQIIEPDTGYNGLSKVTVNSVPTGSAGTPTATKGSVSNHQVSVTPKVTNTTGYITGGTKTGTAVTVKASDLVSGTLSVTSNGTADVTNYKTVNVNVPSSSVPVCTVSYNMGEYSGMGNYNQILCTRCVDGTFSTLETSGESGSISNVVCGSYIYLYLTGAYSDFNIAVTGGTTFDFYFSGGSFEHGVMISPTATSVTITAVR